MKRYLILADGSIYEGEAIGASGDVLGEVVFNTSMGGYMETITDAASFGQIVAQTYPLCGNCGAINSGERKPVLSGFIVREICSDGSNFNKSGEFGDYLADNKVVGLVGIDTRALTRKLRDFGTINGMISDTKSDLEYKLSQIKKYKIEGAVKATTCAEITTYNQGGKAKVALLDLGASDNAIKELVKRGFEVVRVPAFTKAEQIVQLKPQGVLISDGAGDPADNKEIIREIEKLKDKKLPTFAIGLGHQLLALAAGAKTSRLKHGHHGCNQPVKSTENGRIYMSRQNSCYAVSGKSLPECAKASYTNVNDKTCAGVEYGCMPAFGVQFNPETSGGPRDTEFLFDKFAEMVCGK